MIKIHIAFQYISSEEIFPLEENKKFMVQCIFHAFDKFSISKS
jgi:hypothetical protein